MGRNPAQSHRRIRDRHGRKNHHNLALCQDPMTTHTQPRSCICRKPARRGSPSSMSPPSPPQSSDMRACCVRERVSIRFHCSFAAFSPLVSPRASKLNCCQCAHRQYKQCTLRYYRYYWEQETVFTASPPDLG
eukprot:3450842-Rhodomonas_salina.1